MWFYISLSSISLSQHSLPSQILSTHCTSFSLSVSLFLCFVDLSFSLDLAYLQILTHPNISHSLSPHLSAVLSFSLSLPLSLLSLYISVSSCLLTKFKYIFLWTSYCLFETPFGRDFFLHISDYVFGEA